MTKRDTFGFDVPQGSIYDEEPQGEGAYSELEGLGDEGLPGSEAEMFRELWRLGYENPSGADLQRYKKVIPVY